MTTSYEAIADALREELKTKEPGSAMPSESALGDMFGVSRTTVRRALGALDYEGLIEPRPGMGWFKITPRGKAVDDALAAVRSAIKLLMQTEANLLSVQSERN
jgi:DNA-binding GntR family transcriptional regulator